MKFWLNTIVLGTLVTASLDVEMKGECKLSTMTYSDTGAAFEGRILGSISNYSNPYDDFVPSKSMKFVDSVYKKNRPPISLNYREFVAPFITSSVIVTAVGFLALITLGLSLALRGRPNKPGDSHNYCRCLPKFAEDMSAEEKLRKLRYFRIKWIVLFNFFLMCTLLADVLSFIGYRDITKGVFRFAKIMKMLPCTDARAR
jgi:hypothetical protein